MTTFLFSSELFHSTDDLPYTYGKTLGTSSTRDCKGMEMNVTLFWYRSRSHWGDTQRCRQRRSSYSNQSVVVLLAVIHTVSQIRTLESLQDSLPSGHHVALEQSCCFSSRERVDHRRRSKPWDPGLLSSSVLCIPLKHAEFVITSSRATRSHYCLLIRIAVVQVLQNVWLLLFFVRVVSRVIYCVSVVLPRVTTDFTGERDESNWKYYRRLFDVSRCVEMWETVTFLLNVRIWISDEQSHNNPDPWVDRDRSIRSWELLSGNLQPIRERTLWKLRYDASGRNAIRGCPKSNSSSKKSNLGYHDVDDSTWTRSRLRDDSSKWERSRRSIYSRQSSFTVQRRVIVGIPIPMLSVIVSHSVPFSRNSDAAFYDASDPFTTQFLTPSMRSSARRSRSCQLTPRHRHFRRWAVTCTKFRDDSGNDLNFDCRVFQLWMSFLFIRSMTRTSEHLKI